MKLQSWQLFGLMGFLTATVCADLYVSPTGSDANTGASWTQALATISNAVARAGGSGSILVSNGVYNIGAEIVVNQALTLTGVGAGKPHVRRTLGNGRVFQIANASAVLDGFTVSGGSNSSTTDKRGAGVLMTGGMVRNCVISNNVEATAASVQGVGIHVAGGTVSNTVISHNSGKDSYGHGAYVKNALMTHCVIRLNNRSPVRRSLYAVVNIQSNGTVRNCRIEDNDNGASTFCLGGGVYINGGVLEDSSVVRNVNAGSTGSAGGGVNLVSGRMANCLIVSNACKHSNSALGGGGVYQSGGLTVHCTIANNASTVGDLVASDTVEDVAGGMQLTGGIVSNSVIFGNTRLGGRSASDISGAPGHASAFRHSCSPRLATGVQGNIASDPLFRNAANGDYRLRSDSPGIDAGGAVGVPVDLTGAARPQDGDGDAVARSDIGAYEATDVNGALNCHFAVDINEAFLTHTAIFTARVFGAHTNGLSYGWNFGNGTQAGAGLGRVSRDFPAMGHYAVSLMVSNDTGEVAQWTWPDCIRVGAPMAYVAPVGGHQSPFDTWAKAATNILAAVQAAVVTPTGTTHVVVSNGTYRVLTAANSIYIGRGITVEGLGGSGKTIVAGVAGAQVYPNFDLDHPDAVVDGFASQTANFGAIVNQGTLRRCILRNNTGNTTYGSDSGFGAGLRMYGGVAEECLIATNTSTAGTYSAGAGVWMSGPSLLRNSVIANNNIPNLYSTAGAGIRCKDVGNRSIVRNCLIARNVTGSASPYPGSGGGVHLNGGRLENCTIVTNKMQGFGAVVGGGLVCLKGTVTNTIVWGNTITTNGFPEVANNVSPASVSLLSYSCAPELTPGVRGNLSAKPRFADFARRNFRLQDQSPCINKGFNQDWMASALDLDSLRRVNARCVDMGAYEFIFPPGTHFLVR